MKHNIKYVISLVFMLLMTQGAWADPTVTIIKQLNGTTTTSPGVVTSEISNGTCTLTVTPAQGNYVTKDFITVYSVVTGDVAQAPRRTPNLDNTPIEVTPEDANADPTGETHYTFAMPDDGSDVEVTVNFQSMVMYDLFIGETQVTELNASDVLKNGKVSFTKSGGQDTAPTYTLTLNGANLTDPVVVGLPNLTIDIQGTNSITTNTTCIQKMANTTPNVTFKSTSGIVGSLTLENTSTETTGVNNISNISISNELALIMLRNSNYTSNTYYFTAGEVHNAQLVPSYGVQVNDMQVYEGNATNVLGDNKVSFDKSSHTLTLNNVSGIEAISTTLNTLDIDLIGSNSLYRSSDGSIFESASGENVTINLKSTGATKGSLTMQTGENSSATFKGNNVTLTVDNSLALLSGNLADNKGTLVYGGNYDLWISGTRVTSANASNVMGNQGTPTVVFDESTNTLTLNGASLTVPIKSNLDNLIIKLKGENSIAASDTVTLINSYKKTATLSFDVDNELGGSLTLTNRGDGATIKNFTSVSLAEGLYIHSNQPGLSYKTVNDEKCYVAQQYGESWTMTINQNASYPIWVYKNSTDGYVQVTESNKANILGEQAETKTVTYNGGTLTLNGATINSGSSYAFVMGDNMTALNVVLVGENTVAGNGFQFTSSSASLTFKTNGTAAGSFAIIDNDGGYYFSSVASEGSGNVPATISCDTGLAYHADTKAVGLPSLGLTIGNTVVTSANKDDVFAGDQELEGKVSFDSQNNILTLNGANLQTSSLVSTLSNLKVKFNNGCHLKEIVSSNSDATLSFELADNSEDGSYICFYSANAWAGFSGDPTLSQNLAYMPNDDTKFIRKVFAPIMAIMDGQLVFKDLYDNNIYSGDFSAFACHYTIDYVDNTPQQATGVYTSDSNIQLEHPCTVTAWLTYTDGLSRAVQSANSVGKLFGFEENEIDGVIGTKVDLPAIIPTIAETDGVTISYEGNVSDNYTKVDLTSQTSVGNTTVIASLTGSNQTSYTLLNSNFSLTVNIVPPAPTISLEAGTYNESQTVTITSSYVTDHSDNASIKYYYGTDNTDTPATYSESLIISESKTLNAWVSAVANGVTYNSDTVQVQYVIRQEAGLEYLANNEHTEDASFTIGGSDNAELPVLLNPNGLTVSYSSSNTNVATVDATTGEVSIVGMGETTITATSAQTNLLLEGIASYVLTVYKDLSHSSIQVLAENNTYTGSLITPTLTITDGDYVLTEDEDYIISGYMQGDMPLDEIVNTGTYTVLIVGGEESGYVGSTTATLTITPKEITADMVTLSEESFTYDGNTHTPNEVGVSYTVGQTTKTLTAGTDYDISYQLSGSTTNVENPTDAGTYNVVVTGKGNYTGTARKEFTIAKASLTNLAVSLEGWTYGETANTPVVTGNTGEGTVTYTYKGANDEIFSATVPTYAGTHTIKATVGETANYNSGEATSTFTIAKADMSMVSVSYEDLVYNGEAQQLFTVNNVPENATVKYILQPTSDPNQMICDPAESLYTTTVPSATNVGYYAMIYKVEGTNNYNGTQASKTYCVQIVPAEITSMTLDKESLSYTGAAQTVKISVMAGDLELGADDYTVTLNDVAVTGDIQATAVGEYTVEVTGIGNFTGSESAAFSIVNRTLDASDVTFNDHWSTFYSADGAYELPEGIGAFVATGVGENTVTVMQIRNIPEKVAVLLNNETTTTTTNASVTGNLLVHAASDKVVNAGEGDFYGLYNGKFMRVTGTIPEGKNYLLVPNAVVPSGNAPQLTIVIDGEATGVNDVRSKKDDVRGDVYDLQGRKVQKLSKKGLYLNNGRKVVVK